jgi:hypothetical protein
MCDHLYCRNISIYKNSNTAVFVGVTVVAIAVAALAIGAVIKKKHK